MKKVLRYVTAYILLLPILLLGLWVFFLGREVVTGMMRTYFVGESIGRGYQAGLYDRVLTLLLGLGWLVLFVVAEELLRRRITKGSILRIFSRFMGVLSVLALFLDSLMLIFLTDLSASVHWTRWLILAILLVSSIAFLFIGWSKRSPWYEKRKSGILEPPPVLPTK
jgi:hypothetical protein